MNMEIKDSKKAYYAPRAKVIEVKVQNLLCGSPDGGNNEKFTLGGNQYNENDWN